MAFCSSVSKTVLFTINIIFWICAAFLTYSAIKYLNLNDGIASFPHERPAQILLVGAGVFFVCGLIGIVATVWENKCVLGMFIMIIFATTVLIFGGMIVMVVGYDAAETSVNDHFVAEYNRYDINISKLEMRYRRDVPVNDILRTDPRTTTTTTKETTSSTAKRTKKTTTTTVATTTTKPNTTTAAQTNTTTTAQTNTTTTAQTNTTTTAQTNTTTAAQTNTTTTAPANVTSAPVTTAAPTTAPPTDNATKVIDEIQTKLKCCGWESYEEWNNYTTWINNSHSGFVPGSCCNETAAVALNMTCNHTLYDMKTDVLLIYDQGCKCKVHDEFTYGYRFLQWTALVLGILAILGLLATSYLAFKKRTDPRELGYSSVVA